MEFKRILVAVDAASESKSPVFDAALVLAENSGAKLMIFQCLRQDTVAELEDRVGIGSQVDWNLAEARQKRDNLRRPEIEHAKAWLEELCRTSASRGLECHFAVDVGKPGSQIV